MVLYTGFVPKNIAPVGAGRIGVFDSKGRRVGIVKTGAWARPLGEKRYSFGAISDLHIPIADSTTDAARALQYFNGTVDFVVADGDLSNNGSDEQLAQYKAIVDANATIPVYGISGNHEYYSGAIEPKIEQYTGKPLYYSFTQGDDIFIMLGIIGESKLFSDAELQWFYETLEANRNKRCLVFQHCMLGYGNVETCGNPGGLYFSHCWNGDGQTQMAVFESLLRHYKNTVWFHGHSHFRFRMQEQYDYANIDESDGFRSVHIPSISRPRVEDGTDDDTNPDYDDGGSEGYVVDVYEDGIHLLGLDFAKGEFPPIASYWLDTTLVEIPAGTFSDPTGTIVV